VAGAGEGGEPGGAGASGKRLRQIIQMSKTPGFDFTTYMRGRRDRARAIRDEAKAGGCMDCGTHQPRLAFHHRDPSTKLATVGLMLTYSEQAIRAEIAKCDVLCARCHTLRHANSRPVPLGTRSKT